MRQSNEGLELDEHRVTLLQAIKTKKRQADDVLTIFSDRCTVKFSHSMGDVEMSKGCWCNACKSVTFYQQLINRSLTIEQK